MEVVSSGKEVVGDMAGDRCAGLDDDSKEQSCGPAAGVTEEPSR